MIENPLVSVIIPIYKVEQYLRECVDSVINQTYNNLEIILVDDGSPDNCPEICDEYAKQDSRIKVIHKPNGGLSDARNAGIEIAKGDYLSFVDSDDVVNINFIKQLLYAAIKNNCEIAICDYLSFEKKNEINISTNSVSKCTTISPKTAFKMQYKSARYVVAWNKIYKKNLFNPDIRYPKGRLHEDAFTTHLLFLASNSIVIISDILYYYRQREGSIMSTESISGILDTIEAHNGKIKLAESFNDDSLLADIYFALFSWHSKIINTHYFDNTEYQCIKGKLQSKKKYLDLKRIIKFYYLIISNKFKLYKKSSLAKKSSAVN